MITVNGKEEAFRSMQVTELLAVHGYEADNVAVEKNGTVLSRTRWMQEKVADNDVFEIIHFVGGG